MDLFVIHEEDFQELQHSIEERIRGVSALPTAERHAAVQECEGEIAEAEQILRSMGLSARSVQDSAPLQQKMAQYEDKVATLRKDLKRAATALAEQEDRDLLMAGGSAGASDLMATSMDQREQLAAETARLQDTSDELRDTIRVAEDTFEVGVGTLHDLDAQRSQMLHIRGNLDDINSNVGKAKRLIRNIHRRAMANKLILAVIILCLLVAIFFIIYFQWIEPATSKADKPAVTPSPSGAPSSPDVAAAAAGSARIGHSGDFTSWWSRR